MKASPVKPFPRHTMIDKNGVVVYRNLPWIRTRKHSMNGISTSPSLKQVQIPGRRHGMVPGILLCGILFSLSFVNVDNPSRITQDSLIYRVYPAQTRGESKVKTSCIYIYPAWSVQSRRGGNCLRPLLSSVNLLISRSHIPNIPYRSMWIPTMQATTTTTTSMTVMTTIAYRWHNPWIDLPHPAPKISVALALCFRRLPQRFPPIDHLAHLRNSEPLASLILHNCCIKSDTTTTKPFAVRLNIQAALSFLWRSRRSPLSPLCSTSSMYSTKPIFRLAMRFPLPPTLTPLASSLLLVLSGHMQSIIARTFAHLLRCLKRMTLPTMTEPPRPEGLSGRSMHLSLRTFSPPDI
jgi:hypothetical protein